MTRYQKGILYPLAFFDLFAVPLTLQQIYQLQYKTVLSLEVIEELLEHDSFISQCVYSSGNYWGLRSYAPDELQERERITSQKWQRAYSIAHVMQWIPFIRTVAVINSLSFNAATQKSDIDFFFITKKNRLWIVRTLVIGWLTLLGLKKTKTSIADKACLGFWVGEDALCVENLQIEEGLDIYFLYWLVQSTPLGTEETWERFWSANQWVRAYLLCSKPKECVVLKPNPLAEFIQGFVEVFFFGPVGDMIDKVLFWLHRRRILSFPENRQIGEPSVVVRRNMLKLHPYDKRQEIAQKFQEKMQKIVHEHSN